MNYPIWETLTIGGPSLIAFIAVLHVYISHLAVGGGLFLWLTDLKAWRENDQRIHDYLRKHIWFFLLLTITAIPKNNATARPRTLGDVNKEEMG